MTVRFLACAAILLAVLGCSSTATTVATTSATTSSLYPAAYQGAKWAANTTISYPTGCSMKFATTGIPVVHDSYYLAPAVAGQTVVASTPISKMPMTLIPYPVASLKGQSTTINICPSLASSTTATSGGVIGFLISGIALFNSYEATGQAALADNVSYTFIDSGGIAQTASFLDSCSSHSNGNTWHYHGLPSCVTSLVDTSTGPSHLLGFALDGFPIYGGRDINGALVATTQLDSCNGISSATPEFPNGAYHYVLPSGVTGARASLPCYSGAVSATVLTAARKLACKMPKMAPGMGM